MADESTQLNTTVLFQACQTEREKARIVDEIHHRADSLLHAARKKAALFQWDAKGGVARVINSLFPSRPVAEVFSAKVPALPPPNALPAPGTMARNVFDCFNGEPIDSRTLVARFRGDTDGASVYVALNRLCKARLLCKVGRGLHARYDSKAAKQLVAGWLLFFFIFLSVASAVSLPSLPVSAPTPRTNATAPVWAYWKASPDLSVTGYNLYYSTNKQGLYAAKIDVGNNLNASFAAVLGQTNYVYATAYDARKVESPFTPFMPAVATNGNSPYITPIAKLDAVKLEWQLVAGKTNLLQRSFDLSNWATLNSYTGLAKLTVLETITNRPAFYRVAVRTATNQPVSRPSLTIGNGRYRYTWNVQSNRTYWFQHLLVPATGTWTNDLVFTATYNGVFSTTAPENLNYRVFPLPQ